MFGHARPDNVVKEMLGVQDKLAYSFQSDVFSWNGWAQCEQIFNAQDKPGQERERLSTICQVPTQLPDLHVTTVFRKVWTSMDTMLRNYA